MEYKEIVAVTGIGGLFQLLATKSDGAIVRNLADKSTRFISARLHNVTPLESIEIYTTGENVRLHEVFEKMKSQETSMPPVDPKKSDNAAIKEYFKAIFPELDEERVYISDMKKILRWYEILKKNDLLDFSQYKIEENGSEATAEATQTPVEEVENPAKKSRAKKTAEAPEEDTSEKPVKKAAAKKKKAASTDEGDVEKTTVKKTASKKKTE